MAVEPAAATVVGSVAVVPSGMVVAVVAVLPSVMIVVDSGTVDSAPSTGTVDSGTVDCGTVHSGTVVGASVVDGPVVGGAVVGAVVAPSVQLLSSDTSAVRLACTLPSAQYASTLSVTTPVIAPGTIVVAKVLPLGPSGVL